jgi:dynein heavy chain
MPRVFCITDA